jgi:hypothetical protein
LSRDWIVKGRYRAIDLADAELIGRFDWITD